MSNRVPSGGHSGSARSPALPHVTMHPVVVVCRPCNRCLLTTHHSPPSQLPAFLCRSFLKEECLKNDTLAKILRDDSASREILQVRRAGCACSLLCACMPGRLKLGVLAQLQWQNEPCCPCRSCRCLLQCFP